MPTIDEVVHEILHAEGGTQVYNAAKRREYYLRTRELKGRKAGGVRPPIRPPARGSNLPAPRKKLAPQAKTTRQRIDELKVRLEKLRTLLKRLGEEAKARSGVEPKESKESKSSDSSGSKSSGTTTAKEKAASKEYYEKHKDDKKTPSQEEKDLQEKVERIRKQISEMREKLAEARTTASKRQQTTR